MNCPICETVPLHAGEMACINCKMTGKEMEFWLLQPARNNMLQKIRDMDHVLTAMLYPMGIAQWLLAILLKDGRLVSPLAEIPAGETSDGEGIFVPVPAIPPKGELWMLTITSPGDGVAGWEDGEPELGGIHLDDDGVVEAVAALLPSTNP